MASPPLASLPPPLASLPMYDWPEVRGKTDAFWAALRDELHARGIEAPQAVDRALPSYDAWQAPGLILSQTCGWPLVSKLFQHVHVVGIPSYGVAGCGTGTYRSALVASTHSDPLALARGRVAINSRDSLSGYWTLAHTLAKRGLRAGQVGAWVETGSHRASVTAVAEGRADLAAIDAVGWQLALDHEPAAQRLSVVGWTDELPALPFVTAKDVADRKDLLLAALIQAQISAPQPYLAGVCAGTLADYVKVTDIGVLARSNGY